MMLQYKKLFEPYTRDGHTIENTHRYVHRECERRGIPKDHAELAFQEIMLELANGREFPLDHCPCGCGIDKSGTAITHEILARAISLDKEVRLDAIDRIQAQHNAHIIAFMHKENEAFVKKNFTPWYTRLREALEFECFGTP